MQRNGSTVATVNAPTTAWTDTGVSFGTACTRRGDRHVEQRRHGRLEGRHVPGNANPTPTPSPPRPPSPRRHPAADPEPPTATLDPPTAPEPLEGTAGLTTVEAHLGRRDGRHGPRGLSDLAQRHDDQDRRRRPGVEGHLAHAVDLVLVHRQGDRRGRQRERGHVHLARDPGRHRAAERSGLPQGPHSGAYVTFDWTPSTDNVKVLKYRIYREGRTKAIAATTISKIRIPGPGARATSGPSTRRQPQADDALRLRPAAATASPRWIGAMRPAFALVALFIACSVLLGRARGP